MTVPSQVPFSHNSKATFRRSKQDYISCHEIRLWTSIKISPSEDTIYQVFTIGKYSTVTSSYLTHRTFFSVYLWSQLIKRFFSVYFGRTSVKTCILIIWNEREYIKLRVKDIGHNVTIQQNCSWSIKRFNRYYRFYTLAFSDVIDNCVNFK